MQKIFSFYGKITEVRFEKNVNPFGGRKKESVCFTKSK